MRGDAGGVNGVKCVSAARSGKAAAIQIKTANVVSFSMGASFKIL